MLDVVSANDKVIINVSGMRFETWPLTLNRFPNTLLGNPHKRQKYFDYIQNEYFFERHRQSFESILFFYQSKGRWLNRPLSVSSEVFFDEIVFFELGPEVIKKYKKDEGYLIDGEVNVRDLPRNKFKRSIWLLFEYPHSSIYARIVAIISVFIIIISIALFCAETLPQVKERRILKELDFLKKQTQTTISSTLISKSSDTIKNMQPLSSNNLDPPAVIMDEFFVIETICIIWFSIELIMRFFAAPNKIVFMKTFGNIIDLLSILPYFMQASETSEKFSILRIVRLVRVFRIFKLARHFKGLQILAHTLKTSFNELMLLVFFIIIGVILFASMVYFVELDHPTSDFNSILDGFWYAIITMTTVGYGEIVPKTVLGRFVGSLCALVGVLTIALPVPIIVSHFQFFYQSSEVVKKLNKETLKKSYIQENQEEAVEQETQQK